MSETVESLVAYCRENRRVCPLPSAWNRLWEMLPGRFQDDDGWRPPLPLILAAWYHTPGLLKMFRLEEHIEWAAKHGALEAVGGLLRGLREDDWLHISD